MSASLRTSPRILTVNGVKFTQKEVDFLIEYCTVRYPQGKGSTTTNLFRKISKAYPNWKMPARMTFFRFAYGEGIVKL